MLYFICVVYVFFFKQKTAYEMRISDWSSDVCSSDLGRSRHGGGRLEAHGRELSRPGRQAAHPDGGRRGEGRPDGGPDRPSEEGRHGPRSRAVAGRCGLAARAASYRSEEHTSELQSLMRI